MSDIGNQGEKAQNNEETLEEFTQIEDGKSIHTPLSALSYGNKFQDHLLEQYKLYVEMMDRMTSRRGQMNSFYTTLSSLLALIALITNKDQIHFTNSKLQLIAIGAISFLGVLLCFIWYNNVQSYKELNSSKFKVISEIESMLPFACYDKEWEVIKRDKRYKGYQPQTKVERFIPFILSLPYFGLLAYCLLNVF
jgi:hypothetical protein